MKLRNTAIGVVAATLFISALQVTQTFAVSNVLYILDASGSMWGRFDGEIKIVIAKNVLSERLKDTPPDMNIGLLAYGHRVKDDCTDLELIVPIGGSGPREIISSLGGIKPKGKTPIAGALDMSLTSLQGHLEENNHVVVISDGLETCDGDPCASAQALAAAGINTHVHVVGFDIDAQERAQLECISDNGNGQYFPANSTQELTTAIAELHVIAQSEPEPEPEPEPEFVEYFRDDFDGDVLGEQWEVINPDTDSYIVEDGFLNILSTGELSIFSQSDDHTNLFKLAKPLPKGDWIATLRLIPSIATFREVYSLSLYTDKDKFLVASAFIGVATHKGHIITNLLGRKVSKGKSTDFSQGLFRSPTPLGHSNVSRKIDAYTEQAATEIEAILLRIRKVGRGYHVAGMVETGGPAAVDEAPQWVELSKLTSLRAPGKNLTISVGQSKFDRSKSHLKGGETLVNIDWVKIEVEK